MASASFEDKPSACLRCGHYAPTASPDAPKVMCPECGRETVDVTGALSRISIPSPVLDIIPESVARENNVVPFDDGESGLVLLADISEPSVETVEKLRIILNRPVTCLHADADSIRRAIDRDYSTR